MSLLVGGSPESTEEWHTVTGPASGDTLAEVAMAGRRHVDSAVAWARRALADWGATPPRQRALVLERFAQSMDSGASELAELMHIEMGKPRAEADAEVARAAEVVHYFAAEAERIWAEQLPGPTLGTGSWVRPAPIGVVAAITPWNFPVALVIWKLAPALAAGCTVVVKPAIEAPLAVSRVCELASAAGFPPGTINCLTGDGPLLGEALATHPGVDKVAFTGSRRVAEQIATWAAPRLKALTLELGGHGALVAHADADPDLVAEVAVVQGYANAGQACYSVNRVLLPPALVDPVLERMRARIATLELGPMATERGLTRHEALLDDARAKGARVEGGERVGSRRLAPAIVTGAYPGVRLVDEEPFTPIVAVMEAPDLPGAIAEVNRPDYGLVSYVCGADMRACLETAQKIECGTVVVNGWKVVVPYAPYGGWRGSGIGTELGRPGLEAFVRWQHLRVLT